MYPLELDLELFFVPPMEDFGNGISVTRTLDLPFVPHSGLSVFGKELTDSPLPPGIVLEQLTWDIDRQLFLARSTLTIQDWPIVAMPNEIRQWIVRRWRLGSHLEQYENGDGTQPDANRLDVNVSDLPDYVFSNENWSELIRLQEVSHRKRPPKFNTLFHVVIRTMTERHNNQASAYAMYKTQRFFSESQCHDPQQPTAARQFRDAQFEFETMSLEKQAVWSRTVKRKYPSLRAILGC
jgi:hypothetical protein